MREPSPHLGLDKAVLLETQRCTDTRGVVALAVCRRHGCECGGNKERRMAIGMLIGPLESCHLIMVTGCYECFPPSPTPSSTHTNSYPEALSPNMMGFGITLGGN